MEVVAFFLGLIAGYLLKRQPLTINLRLKSPEQVAREDAAAAKADPTAETAGQIPEDVLTFCEAESLPEAEQDCKEFARRMFEEHRDWNAARVRVFQAFDN